MNGQTSSVKFPHKDLTRAIIGSTVEVHRTLGCGFLESVYEEALAVELALRDVPFERQKPLDVKYKGRNVKRFICDFFVGGAVLIELKAIKELSGVETAQLVNYLKATGVELGLLLNFGTPSLQYKRVIN